MPNLTKFDCKMTGLTFRSAEDKDALSKANPNETIFDLVREPENEYHDNAVKVLMYMGDSDGEDGLGHTSSYHVGYIERGWADQIAPQMDEGHIYQATWRGYLSKKEGHLTVEWVRYDDPNDEDEIWDEPDADA